MTFNNKTERESHLNWLIRDRIKSCLSLAVLIKSDQLASAKSTYFSERFKR